MSFQILQTLDLLFTHSRIIDFENIDGSLFFKTVFVYTHDRLFTRVDTCLRTGGSLFDTKFRESGFDGLSHTAQLLDLLNMFPCLMSQLVSQSLYIIRTCPRVDFFCNIGLFLNINLSITSDTSRKIGWQGDSLVESVGVQRLGMPQSSPHSLDTSTTHIIERILFGQ